MGLAAYWFQFKVKPESRTLDIDQVMQAIKHLESENPPRIGKTPTDEEIYSSAYIKQIRVAIDGYLDGTNVGFEESALEASSDTMKCGLNNFAKDSYIGKFVVLDASDNDYGGVQAYVTFIDKPYKVFWAWVYRLDADDGGDMGLRTLCEADAPTSEQKEMIDERVADSDYYL